MVCHRIKSGFVCEAREFKPGDIPPENLSYLDSQEFHEVQYKAGLRQTQCPKCGKYRYPQQFSTKKIEVSYSKTKHGPVITEEQEMCIKCSSVH